MGTLSTDLSALNGATCPKCQMRLWPKAIPPKNICFRTMRATFGTVACEVAGGTDFAKVLLGHEPEDDGEALHRCPCCSAPRFGEQGQVRSEATYAERGGSRSGCRVGQGCAGGLQGV